MVKRSRKHLSRGKIRRRRQLKEQGERSKSKDDEGYVYAQPALRPFLKSHVVETVFICFLVICGLAAMVLLRWDSKAIKAGTHGVPGGENTILKDDGTIRYYTLREMAIIQGFPNQYLFKGARSSVIRQIGNAVPPNLAKAIALPLARVLGATS